jgi:hypothetical protein
MMRGGAHIMRFGREDEDGCRPLVCNFNIRTREQWYHSWRVCRINAKRGRTALIFGATFDFTGKLQSVSARPCIIVEEYVK